MVRLVTGLIGLGLLATFVLGLAHSISTGFAGLLGGLPFVIIVVTVLGFLVYDLWDDVIRKMRK